MSCVKGNCRCLVGVRSFIGISRTVLSELSKCQQLRKLFRKKDRSDYTMLTVYLVQPGTISLITEPKYDEIPPEPKPLAQLQEGKPEGRSPLPPEIMALLRIAMRCSSDKRKEVLADFKRASEKWRSSGIIEIPDKYSKGERNE